MLVYSLCNFAGYLGSYASNIFITCRLLKSAKGDNELTMYEGRSDTIFELKSIRIDGGRYPIRRVYHQQIGLYSSQENAEAAIRTFVEGWRKQDVDLRDDYLGFIIYQRMIDSRPDRDNCISICTFNADGVFNDRNMRDTHRKFHGRPQELIRFKEGDIVEVVDDYRIELCIVAAQPPNIHDFERIKARAEADMRKRGVADYIYEMDDGDDQYMVYPMNGDYHLHVRSEMVFPPTKKVSYRLRQKLLKQYEKFE
jgi:hypothetical protein